MADHDAAGFEAGAAFGHLHVVDPGELGVELAGGIGAPDHGGPAQGRPGLAHRLAFTVGVAGPGGQAQVGLEVVAAGEPGGVAHDRGHGRAADLGQARHRPGDLAGAGFAVGVLAGGRVGLELGLDGVEQADLGGQVGIGHGRVGGPVQVDRLLRGADPRLGPCLALLPWGGPAAPGDPRWPRPPRPA